MALTATTSLVLDMSGSLSISTTTQSEIVAPAVVWFEAENISGFTTIAAPSAPAVYKPEYHDITYIWEFDDFGAFEPFDINIPTVWNDRSVMKGPKACHVFGSPGTYTVRVWAIDGVGTVGVATVTVTVQDPDSVYSGNRTICIGTDFVGAPADAQQVATFDQARTAYGNLGSTGRLLLRRGETFTGQFSIGDPMQNCHIGAFGVGAKPIWQPDPAVTGQVCLNASFGHSCPEATIWGIRFEGDWDATKEVGDPDQEGIMFYGFNTVSFVNTIYQCEFDGFSKQRPHYWEPTSGRTAVVECDIGNFRDYGMFSEGASYNVNHFIAIIGSTIHSAENACVGNYGKIGLSNEHNPFRYGDPINVIISGSSFYSASSWPVGTQPSVRFAQKITGLPATGVGFYIQCDRCVFEGGDTVFGIDGQNEWAEEVPGNFIFDSILSVGDYNSLKFTYFSFGGATMRNAVVVHPDMNRLAGAFPPETFISLGVDLPAAGNQDAPMKFYNNTFLNFSSATMDVQRGSTFNDLTIENNVNHQPNAGVTGAAPVDLTQTIAGFSPRNRGRRKGPEKKPHTLAATVAPGNSFTVGYPLAGDGVTELSSADFLTSGRHTFEVAGTAYFSWKSDFTIAFGAEITITNTSGVTWTGGAACRMALDQDTLTTDTSLASPATIPLPRVGTGSSALAAANTGLAAATDFATAFRPVTNETSEEPDGTTWPTGDVHGGAVQETA